MDVEECVPIAQVDVNVDPGHCFKASVQPTTNRPPRTITSEYVSEVSCVMAGIDHRRVASDALAQRDRVDRVLPLVEDADIADWIDRYPVIGMACLNHGFDR